MMRIQNCQYFPTLLQRFFWHRILEAGSEAKSKKLACPECKLAGGVSGKGWRKTLHEVLAVGKRMWLLESGLECSKCNGTWGTAKGEMAETFFRLNFPPCVKEELPVTWTAVNSVYGWHVTTKELVRELVVRGLSFDEIADVLYNMEVCMQHASKWRSVC